MLDEVNIHHREMINEASRLISVYFQKNICFSKVTELSEPDRRNIILRLQIDNPSSEMPSTVILKKNSTETRFFEIGESETEAEQFSRFAHDWAGIEFLTKINSDHAPYFYAGNIEHAFILIEDLGLLHPSLVGPLTRVASLRNIQEAESALTLYVTRLAKMQVDTVGKFNQFTSILNRIDPKALRLNYLPSSDEDTIIKIFKKTSGYSSNKLNQEINSVLLYSQEKNEFNVFLHGDICPDNVYYHNNDIRMIDFEWSDFGNALIDGTYLRMHMPSCWCAKAIPKSVLNKMEFIYRSELKKGIMLASDDYAYNKNLSFSCAYWLLRTIKQIDEMGLIEREWICPSGPVDPDSQWKSAENAFRPRIISRIKSFIDCAQSTGHLSELCAASEHLLLFLKKVWPETKEIDLFSVFR